MSRIFTSVEQLIGHTPLLELTHFEKEYYLSCCLLSKLEYFNPAGSVKDRVALQMILNAEEEGLLTRESVIIEPTSGNTGIGIASVAAAKGYRVVIVMPDSMSIERRLLMKAYGAELILTPGKLGMKGAIEEAERLKDQIPHAFLAGQFVNPANPLAHIRSTGPEIWEDTDGKVDIFVSGVGTGGTLTGCGRYLKEKNPMIKIVAVEPSDSPVLSKGKGGPHGIQGIGAGFVPDVLDTSLIDEVVTVELEDALKSARLLGKTEGILCGISSGAALHAAIQIACYPENTGKNIVVLLPDNGERYLSSALYQGS